jgi:hypothetical protein
MHPCTRWWRVPQYSPQRCGKSDHENRWAHARGVAHYTASSGAAMSCSSTRAGRERRVRTCQSESLDGDTYEHGSFWRVVPRESDAESDVFENARGNKRRAAWSRARLARGHAAASVTGLIRRCTWTRRGPELGSDSRSSGVGDHHARAVGRLPQQERCPQRCGRARMNTARKTLQSERRVLLKHRA